MEGWQMIRSKIIIIFLLVINFENAFGKVKVCKIKYNERDGLQSLEKKINKDNRQNYNKDWDDNIFKCYKIGVEHDQNQIPMENSPIYACCKNQ